MIFGSHVQGIPCQIKVIDAEPYRPARLRGHPDTWCEAEGGDVTWTVLDRKGYPAPWLLDKVTTSDEWRIKSEAQDALEREMKCEY